MHARLRKREPMRREPVAQRLAIARDASLEMRVELTNVFNVDHAERDYAMSVDPAAGDVHWPGVSGLTDHESIPLNPLAPSGRTVGVEDGPPFWQPVAS